MRAVVHVSFLDQLPAEDKARLMPTLQQVTLTLDDTLYQAGQTVPHVFFLLTAQVQEVLPMGSGHEELLRNVGPGEVAGSCVLADPVTMRTARVSHAGEAWRMPYGDFARALAQMPRFRELIMQDAWHVCVS